MTDWVSTTAPMVNPAGDVPREILAALTTATGRSGSQRQAATTVRRFLAEVCEHLAEARAQVVEDRAELDGYRNRYGPLPARGAAVLDERMSA